MGNVEPVEGAPARKVSVSPEASRREELFAFVILAIVIWPILAIGTVGGYGFLVWMYQLIAGPPGPPH